MIKKLSVLCFSLFMIFVVLSLALAELADAQTLVAGKIYNSDYSDVIADVDVTVTCTHASTPTSLSTVSLNDGTYAVKFPDDTCAIGDAVKVSASKGTLSGETSGSVVACESDQACTDSDYVAILNLNMKTKTSSSGGSSSSGGWDNFYLCGNGKCDTGETTTTCPRDCKTTEIVQTSEGVETTETSPIEEAINSETMTGRTKEIKDKEGDGSFGLSGITGAVIGALEDVRTIIATIFLIILICLLIIVRVIRRRKRLEIGY